MNSRILTAHRQEKQKRDMLRDLLNWADVIIGDLENKGTVLPRDLEAFKKAVERFGTKPTDCPLCGKPSNNGEVHKECADYENSH